VGLFICDKMFFATPKFTHIDRPTAQILRPVTSVTLQALVEFSLIKLTQKIVCKSLLFLCALLLIIIEPMFGVYIIVIRTLLSFDKPVNTWGFDASLNAISAIVG